MTSFDVVKRLKKVFNTSKVGHGGTLDPMAEGVLVCAINQATKALPFIGIDTKTYSAELKLGFKTDTGDIWGKMMAEKKQEIDLSKLDLDRLAQRFTGSITQKVPLVSAKKYKGKRLYDYAFSGESIAEELYTEIEVFELRLSLLSSDSLSLTAKVSKGTYIRSLCEDIAEALGELGSMSSLKRIQAGKFTLDQALALEEINHDTALIPVRDALVLPQVQDSAYNTAILHGKSIELDCLEDELLIDGGEYFAVYKREKEKIFKPVRGLW